MKNLNYCKHCLWLIILFSFTARAGVYDNLVPVKIATGMQFTEGPEYHPDGYLVFSDINGNVIYKWSETLGLDTLVYPAYNSNGIVSTKSNTFFLCRHGLRDIAKMDTLGKVTSVLSKVNGKRFNSPNDLTLSYMGSIYFTDPDYGVAAQDRELTYQGLFCLPYNSTTPVLLDSTLLKPNGLTFANDWRTLFVCESSTNTIYSYNLRDECTIQDFAKDKKVFVKVLGTGEIDGLTSDVFGNLYVAFGDAGIKIYDKSAKEIGLITLPVGEKVRNLTFGGKYYNQLFVTAGTSLYKIDIRFYGDLIAPGLLGVPSDKSVIFNALSDKEMDAYIAYGTDVNSLSLQTTTANFPANTPIEIILDKMTGNTKYYYKFYYKLKGQTTYSSATTGSFFTQRISGSSFSFAVEADPHLDEGSNYITFRNTLQNELNLSPDFMIDLGDNFMTEKFPIVNKYYVEQRNLLYRNFWDKVCSSMPLFIVIGNHEGELKWMSTNQENDEFNMTTAMRKKYYPTPQPDGFYTGNETNELFVGKRENYYAWNWGDALFVVIDPYGYTEAKPTEGWGFTLGKTQYDWFRKTLEGSKAKFKFVFAHQIVGGDAEGRGGSERVDYCEMGGKNLDGTYGFDTKRPGWGKPLHQIMVENGVQIYFHGHDHLYAEQLKDGIIYQEVPQPSFPGYTVANDAAAFGYTQGLIIPSSGHLNVKVMGDSATVDYIGGYHLDNKALGLINGTSRRKYSVKAKTMNTDVATPTNIVINAYQSGKTVYINSSENQEIQVNLYSIAGNVLVTEQKRTSPGGTLLYELPKDLPEGVYLLSLNGKNYKTTLKLVL